MVRLIGGRDALASAVGLKYYKDIRRQCTQLVAPMLLPIPIDYCGSTPKPDWRGVVMVTASREQWGEEIWAAAHPVAS